MVLVSGYFRRRARQSGEVIRRESEGWRVLLARLLAAAELYLPFAAYAVQPSWMEWSSMSLPLWLRWLASIVSVTMLPGLVWVMISIGKNVSETYLTKDSHKLITAGPYRWVRHPLYTVAAIALVSLSIVAANWLMLALTIAAPIALPCSSYLERKPSWSANSATNIATTRRARANSRPGSFGGLDLETCEA